MNRIQKSIAIAAFAGASLFAAAAQANYAYLHSEGEYSIVLPDAPLGRTIWADDKKPIPFLPKPPRYGIVGEEATFRRMDTDRGDMFDVSITMLKADKEFLKGLNEEIITEMLKDRFSGLKLDDEQITFTTIGPGLTWGVLSGFTVDAENNLQFNAGHFLTGAETITYMRVTYNAENPQFEEQYKKIISSVEYKGK